MNWVLAVEIAGICITVMGFVFQSGTWKQRWLDQEREQRRHAKVLDEHDERLDNHESRLIHGEAWRDGYKEGQNASSTQRTRNRET